MKDIEIISWVKFNKPGLKEKVEEIAKQSDSEIRFIQNLRDTFDISLADAKEVANKFYKQLEVHMIELKREGLYIANGKNISVLIKVTGQTPYLDIPCGVLLNDMQNRNCVTVLDRNSPEIQDILSNPTQYVYDFPTVSDAINNKEGLETTEHERIEYSTETFNEWVNAYLRLREAYPDGYYVKTVIYLMKKGYAKSQADLIIKQIVNHIHRKCEL